jgi:hypothetical protein
VLKMRQKLEASDLGALGAAAIHQALVAIGRSSIPSVRTVNRILARNGVSAQRRTKNRPCLHAPPRGWYLPAVASGRCELDSFDIVEALVIRRGLGAEVLNGVSLHGGLTVSWPVAAPVTARFAAQALAEHWRTVGLPAYAQFDNDPIFQGTHNSPVALGRVVRLCLSLGVTPVFVPPGEFGFQSMIEGYNHWWQAKVWARFAHVGLADLQGRSRKYVDATRRHRANRILAAPRRRPFPQAWRLDLQVPPRGQIVYLRRTNANGELDIFGQSWRIAEPGPRRLVRVELDLTHKQVRFFSLSRSDPSCQTLLLEARFQVPIRRFRDRSRYA